jgi:hypothetical protein
MRESMQLLSLFLINVSICVAQNGDIKNHPDSADEKVYFDLLYSTIGGINSPITNLVKVEFIDCECFAITNKNGINDYCKEKFVLSDSLANLKGREILLKNTKLPTADTLYFDRFQKSVFPLSRLKSFRDLSLVDFLNKYVKKNEPGNVLVAAYLFEKRILYDFYNSSIPYSYDFLRSKYGLNWNNENKEWTIRKKKS